MNEELKDQKKNINILLSEIKGMREALDRMEEISTRMWPVDDIHGHKHNSASREFTEEYIEINKRLIGIRDASHAPPTWIKRMMDRREG